MPERRFGAGPRGAYHRRPTTPYLEVPLSASLVVRAHRPGRTALLVVLVLVVVTALGAGLFELGQVRGGFNREQAGVERDLLEGQLGELEQQEQLLRARIALLEESSRIDREAAAQLRATLAAQDQELTDLRQELMFYRGIVSPEDGQAGLRLQELTLEAAADGGFRFELVLIQALRHDRDQSGVARIRVSGSDADGPRELALPELATDGGASIPYTFRYFLRLTGEIHLPDGFIPEAVHVTLDPEVRGQADVERSFDWSGLVASGT